MSKVLLLYEAIERLSIEAEYLIKKTNKIEFRIQFDQIKAVATLRSLALFQPYYSAISENSD